MRFVCEVCNELSDDSRACSGVRLTRKSANARGDVDCFFTAPCGGQKKTVAGVYLNGVLQGREQLPAEHHT